MPPSDNVRHEQFPSEKNENNRNWSRSHICIVRFKLERWEIAQNAIRFIGTIFHAPKHLPLQLPKPEKNTIQRECAMFHSKRFGPLSWNKSYSILMFEFITVCHAYRSYAVMVGFKSPNESTEDKGTNGIPMWRILLILIYVPVGNMHFAVDNTAFGFVNCFAWMSNASCSASGQKRSTLCNRVVFQCQEVRDSPGLTRDLQVIVLRVYT